MIPKANKLDIFRINVKVIDNFKEHIFLPALFPSLSNMYTLDFFHNISGPQSIVGMMWELFVMSSRNKKLMIVCHPSVSPS